MSLYNMLFGVNPAAPVLLTVLGIELNNIPRFRDCFVNGNEIVVHTRTGGGNRDYYDKPNEENKDGPWNSSLTSHPNYLRNEDNDFDCTYANFYFSFPDEYAEDLKALAEGVETHTPSEKWQALFKALDNSNKQEAK